MTNRSRSLKPEHTYISQDPLFNKIAAEANRVGMNWAVGEWPFFVNGKHLSDTPDDLVHDLAHWLVSPPRLRTKRHFGLSHPFSAGEVGGLVPAKRSQQLEEEASMLGIVLYRELGADTQDAVRMARHHGWDSNDDPPPQVVVARLEKKGLWSPKRGRIWGNILRKAKSSSYKDEDDDG